MKKTLVLAVSALAFASSAAFAADLTSSTAAWGGTLGASFSLTKIAPACVA